MTNFLPNLSTIARRSGFCGCSNCCGGFGCPHICHHCCGGCCGCGCCGCGDSMTFPVTFGACVDNPCCQCCKKPPKKGFCQWPCMWPCCCECKVPEFKLKPLKPKAVPKECQECCHGCCQGCCHGCCHCCHCCRKRGGKVLANNTQPWSKRVLISPLLELILLEHHNPHHCACCQFKSRPRSKSVSRSISRIVNNVYFMQSLRISVKLRFGCARKKNLKKSINPLNIKRKQNFLLPGDCSKRCFVPQALTSIQPFPYVFNPLVPVYYGVPLATYPPYYYF